MQIPVYAGPRNRQRRADRRNIPDGVVSNANQRQAEIARIRCSVVQSDAVRVKRLILGEKTLVKPVVAKSCFVYLRARKYLQL